MELKFIKYEKRGHLAYITLNRPEVHEPHCIRRVTSRWIQVWG